jgi:DNA gyrase subunit A
VGEDATLLFVTEAGTVKRTPLEQHARPRAGGSDAIGIRGEDRLLRVLLSDGSGDVVLVSGGGRAIRFPEAEVPVTGRGAQGVRGIRLREGDAVRAALVARRDAEVCLLTEQGWGKRLPVEELAVQARGGLGAVTLPVTRGSGRVVAALELLPEEELQVTTREGRTLRLPALRIPPLGRADAAEPVLPLDGDAALSAQWAVEREVPRPDTLAMVEEPEATEELVPSEEEGEPGADLDLFAEAE